MSEILQPWGDAPAGEDWQFSRGKMEKHLLAFTTGDQASRLPADLVRKLQGGAACVEGFTGKVKKEDVDFLTQELLLTKLQAEKVLAEHDADLSKALKTLLAPAAASS